MLPVLAVAAAFSLDALAHLVTLSDAAISPDGAHVAFVATHPVLETNSYRGELWLYDFASRRLRLLDAAHASYSSPQWSPNANTLAFVADDAATHADQLFVLDLGRTSPHRVTAGETGVENYAWQPGGGAIAFSRADATPPKHGAAVYEDAFEVTDNDYLATAAVPPSHLWLAEVRGNHATRLTSGTWSVADATLSWSPDGKRLSYLRVPSAIHGVDDRAAAYVLNVAARTSLPLTVHPAYEDEALWSPDGTHALYLYPRDGDPANATTVMDIAAGGAERDLTRDLDRHVDTAAWMPGGNAALVKVYDAAAGPLYEQPLDGTARRLPLGDVVDAEIAPVQSVSRAGTIAFVGTEAARAGELYALPRGATRPVRLTDFNAAVTHLNLGRVATVGWESPDGFHEAGVLTYPPGYVAGKRYPLVLRIHGGPTETSEAAFEPFYQLAAAHGYLVFAPNYRGSSNLGSAFEHAVFNDASEGPGNDVMAGVTAVEKLGIVDESRIGVSGWSYGGQLTSWMIGHYQIWKCAVTGAAVNDLVVDYTIADDIDADRVSFSDSPFTGNELAAWQRQSPITYFKDIHAPLLLLGNVYDVRVPIVEQYEMYHALRDNGVPVQFFAYPSGGHLPRGPVRLADAYRRWLAWFDRYLRP